MRSLPAGVAAGHPATAEVGRGVLAAGGSAADATAAMILAGCVVETIFTGLAGGGFATVCDAATRSVTCLDFFVAIPGLDGTKPSGARAIEVSFDGVQVPYDVGGATVAVPGTPSGVAELHRRFGRLPWAQVVSPAQQLAVQGAPVPAEHAALLADVAPAMVLGEGGKAYIDPQTSQLLTTGQILHHPGLAETLAAYRDGGVAALMADEWAQDFVAVVRGEGGALSMKDLAAYQVRELPLSDQPFGRGRVRSRTNDLDHFADTLAAVDSAAMAAGGQARALALVNALGAPVRRAETTSVAAVDAEGNACAATHSLGLGSGVWHQGVHGNSMLGEGELVRGALVPGERMGSMMVPSVVTDDDGQLCLVLGAAGGSRIRPAMVQVLAGVLVDGQDLADAVAAPRLSCTTDTVHLEPKIEPEVVAGLHAAGFQVRQWATRKAYFGGVAGIGPDGPVADPRRGGAGLPL